MNNWTTLEGRLKHAQTSRIQLKESGCQLSDLAERKLEELTKELRIARLNQPKVTLKEAQEQAKRIMDAARYGKHERSIIHEIK